MVSRTVDQIQQSPWARLVWAGVGVVALVQVAVFYQLCTSQVARAQARETIAVEQRNTLTDCLDYRHKSTISSCSRQAGDRSADRDSGSLANRDLPRARSSQAIISSVVPASYVYH